jgi:hypothetical protein
MRELLQHVPMLVQDLWKMAKFRRAPIRNRPRDRCVGTHRFALSFAAVTAAAIRHRPQPDFFRRNIRSQPDSWQLLRLWVAKLYRFDFLIGTTSDLIRLDDVVAT